MEREIIILNKLVKILLTKTECGINVLIAGGDFAHIGAVSIVDPQGEIFTKIFEGHKDHFVSEEWAEKLYEKFQVPVVVSAGIHYDNIDSTGIENVISEMKKALDLPENEEVVMMLDLGYGNQKEPLPNHHLKKELAETVKYL